MSTITLPNIRVSSDLTVKLKLKDGGVALDWSTLTNIKVSIYSDAQRALAGRCSVAIDAEDSTLLVCTYAANKPQYVGVNRVVVSAKYMNETKTYDKPAFNFVRWTDDQEGQTITIDDPDIDVEISVEDISSSILQEAVDAANTAAERANEAAEAAEHMVDIHTGPEGKSAYEVAVEEGYTGTEEEWLASLKGDTGETPDITIGTVTTVEPGTPAAATMTGTPEDPVLNLTIPKGAVGATPNFTVGTVTTGQPGTPVVVTITGTPEAPVLNITIPQGLQGNTGSSVDYPYELVNNLTTNDATKGLSAAQGVVLDGKVSQLEAEVDEKLGFEQKIESNTNGYSLNADGELTTNAYTTDRGVSDFFKVTPGGELYIQSGVYQGGTAQYSSIAFYSSNSENSFVSGVHEAPFSTEIINQSYFVPSSANYARVVLKDYSIPAVIGKQEKSVKEYLDELGSVINIIEDKTDTVNQTSVEYCTESNYGISALTGEKVSKSSWKASDYIAIPGGITIAFKSRSATTYGIAFYTEQSEASFISGVVSTGSEQSIVVPASARYFRFCDYSTTMDGYVRYTVQIDGLESKVENLEETVGVLSEKSIYDNACFDSKVIIESGQKILGLGASFMRGNDTGTGTNNVWLHLLAQKVGTTAYNDANGGTNICYHANRIFNGTILGTGNAPISEIGAVIIMHSHDKDVFTLPEPFASYTVAQYESNVLPFATTTGDSPASVEYAKAFDYIIKKIQALYFADKSSTEYASGVQSYVGQYYFKPAQIIFCTHWHDARITYNTSIRKLCVKWGLPLVQFDKKIGFTRLQKNTAFNAQASLEFVGNVGGASPVETINGVAYGWHPMCGGTDVYIQRKMASIAKESFELI